MLRELREDIRVNLKDRLREIRHLVRAHRHDRAAAKAGSPFPLNGIEDLFGHAASAVDDAISIAGALVPADRVGSATHVRGFIAYFPQGEAARLDGERAFRRDMYAMAKMLLHAGGIAEPRISEANFAAIHAALMRHHGDLLAGMRDSRGEAARVEAAARICAALVIEGLRHRPVQVPPQAADAPIALDRSVEIACLSAIALACGAASIHVDEPGEPDDLTMASLVAGARLDRIQAALGQGDRQARLTEVFASLLGHLR